MIRDIHIISSIFALILIGLVFILTDGLMSKPEYFSGNVIDKHYKAERHTHGTGIGVISSGQTGVVITSQSESEKFLLIIKTENGKVLTAKCNPELYYQKEIGQSIEIAIYKGRFTGMSWAVWGVR